MTDKAVVPPAKAARLLFQLPRDCRVFTAISPPNQWGWSEITSNKIAYLLEVLVWQNTKDATKKAPRHKPKPFIPDFMKPKPDKTATDGALTMAVEDIKSILELPRG